MPTIPFIFCAFANDKERYLKQLPNEANDIAALFRDKQQLCNIEVLSDMRPADLHDVIVKRHEDIHIVHYGGHADGYQTYLTDDTHGRSVFHGSGLVGLLKSLPNLKLVFINGCQSAQMVNELYDAGIPAVIGTTIKINDLIAFQLSVAFYKAIAQGLTIANAWNAAAAFIKGLYKRDNRFRGMSFDDDDIYTENPNAAWFIKLHEGAGNWKLSEIEKEEKTVKNNKIEVKGNHNTVIQDANNSQINIGNTYNTHHGEGDIVRGNKIININSEYLEDIKAKNKVQPILKGMLLHSLPNKMQLHNLHRCIIRVAFDKETILKDLPNLKDGVIIKEDIRVSNKMEVIFHKSPYFEITELTKPVQIVEPFSMTQWDFDIRPYMLGQFPLSFIVSVILPEGVKELVTTIQVMVVIEPVGAAMEFVVSTLDLTNKKINKNPIAIWKDMVVNGKIKDAIKYLIEKYENDKDKHNMLILLLARYNINDIKRSKRIIDNEIFDLEQFRIIEALLTTFE